MFKVQTELVKLDIKEILENYRRPKFWKKKWVVFRTRDFDIVFFIRHIDVESNYIQGICKIANFKRKGISLWTMPTYWLNSIPIENPEYRQETFNRTILAGVLGLIDDLEKAIVKKTYEYKQAEDLEEEEIEQLSKIAEKFLDKENVKNKDIREAYIESYVSKNAKHEYTRILLSNALRRYYPTARLLACSWFDNKKGFDTEAQVVKSQTHKTKKLIYEIWKARKELDGEEYLKQAQEKLEAI